MYIKFSFYVFLFNAYMFARKTAYVRDKAGLTSGKRNVAWVRVPVGVFNNNLIESIINIFITMFMLVIPAVIFNQVYKDLQIEKLYLAKILELIS